jgi:hypothetical protein
MIRSPTFRAKINMTILLEKNGSNVPQRRWIKTGTSLSTVSQHGGEKANSGSIARSRFLA